MTTCERYLTMLRAWSNFLRSGFKTSIKVFPKHTPMGEALFMVGLSQADNPDNIDAAIKKFIQTNTFGGVFTTPIPYAMEDNYDSTEEYEYKREAFEEKMERERENRDWNE